MIVADDRPQLIPPAPRRASPWHWFGLLLTTRGFMRLAPQQCNMFNAKCKMAALPPVRFA